jgi:glycosyltransferase involved in cell wall biosynthesis
MKLMLVAGGKKGTHAVRWANGLAEKGVDVHFVTQQKMFWNLDDRVCIYDLPYKGALGYFLNVFKIREVFKSINPDLVNVHYASGYGTLARLARLKPVLLSVWGSDVYDFPNKSNIHERLLCRNLLYADAIASTSESMAKYIKDRFDIYSHIYVTPFGVDVDFFKPCPNLETYPKEIVIGTVKTLSKKYGIDTLIRAFKVVCDNLSETYSLKLEITGDGPDRDELVELAENLGVLDKVTFFGFLDKEGVLERINNMDIYAALSRLDSESFGVALLEASSCEKPLVVSDVSGPAEVVKDGITGFVIPRNNSGLAAKKLIELICDPDLRKKMGRLGRAHVCAKYSWDQSLNVMLNVYDKVVD